MRKKYPREEFPREVLSFERMHDRVHLNIVPSISWPRTTAGFYKFLNCVGTIPKSINKHSIGRKNHKRGYSPNNTFWQERSKNNGEPCSRKELRHLQLIKNKKRWAQRGAKAKWAKQMAAWRAQCKLA
jgi:hypothetical protein